MTIVTDNIKVGAIEGMGQGPGSGFIPAGISNIVLGTPDEILTGQTGSDIVFDAANGVYYMCEAPNGSEWITLGSVS